MEDPKFTQTQEGTHVQIKDEGGVKNYCESRYKDYFRCDYGGCLKNRYHCDFIVDCLDGSDERNCSRPECPKSFFECSNKECVTEGKICDGIYDCVDGSDESADFCRPENFKQCKTGKRIHVNFWCDGYINCPFDHADENDCNPQRCAPGDFRCNSDGGRCLHLRFQCDGFCDCLDCQDENTITCSLKRSSGIPDCEKGKSVGCNMHKWHMEKYRCLDKNYICDGANFCGMKSSDYSMCLNATSDSCENMKEYNSRDLFFCNDGPYGRCIDKARRVCNGKRDCLNGEDEENCDFSPCGPGEWQCDGGPCVHESARCNLIYECKDRSDEMHCGQTMSFVKHGSVFVQNIPE
ncbi:hypothetical protein Pcinc_009189 [Petrolisthes cinctipes]|uniref:Uncharacterized protein n=2 Tax=Petrolisthes cinctipes TaxID=88211 RepID=A0AAE1KWT0_PETCI|nr:hypothetical protein Pcinc_010270 [Petrolisthes cinctipes]KAK3886672.1 hypothetical protein Pcinc_009189 [Petrolisthes cinctipes]